MPISLHLLLNGQLSFMQSQGFDVLAASAHGPEIDHLNANGISHRTIPLTRKITPIQDLWCLIALVGLIRSLRPDIVHTHTPKAGLLGMTAAWLCRVPVRIHTVAGIPYQETKGLKRTVLRWVERVTYLAAHRVYPNSTGLRQFMSSEFPDLIAKYKVLGNGSSNGVNIDFFQPTPELHEGATAIRRKYNIPERDPVLCFVGRLVRDKGVIELVRAFKQLSSQNGTPWLLLIGPLEQDLDPLPDDILKEIKSTHHIVCPGFQDDVRPWILASQVLVLPSYREGFPNVLLQACALERPCIATDINGCNEIIDHNRNGFLVIPKNVDSLKSALKQILDEPKMATEMGKLARERIIKYFSQSYIWNELLNEYRHQLSLVQVNDQAVVR